MEEEKSLAEYLEEERALAVVAQPDLDDVAFEPAGEFIPEGVTVLRLDKFTTTVDGKAKVKAQFAAASSKENLLCFFRSKHELVRLTEPDREVPRPDTEIFGRITSFQDTTSDPEMKVIIEFDMSEVILERLSIISFTEPTLVWMHETHRQTKIAPE